MVRLQLALKASQENVRAIAQLTPSAEDAAVLMAGLRAIGQDKTVELVGKKFIQHPAVLLEVATCNKEKDPQKAIEFFNRVSCVASSSASRITAFIQVIRKKQGILSMQSKR